MRAASAFGFVSLCSNIYSHPPAAHAFSKVAESFAKYPAVELIPNVLKGKTCDLCRTAHSRFTAARTMVAWVPSHGTINQEQIMNNDTLQRLRLVAKSPALTVRLTDLSTRKTRHV